MKNQWKQDGTCNWCGLQSEDHEPVIVNGQPWKRCPDADVPRVDRDDDPWAPSAYEHSPTRDLFDSYA